jgi:SAM-dependent methyltransferase
VSQPPHRRDVAADRATRFTNRVADYVRYRPSYPAALFDVLCEETGIAAPVTVADVGAGTGMASALFLARGHTVFAIEPNDAMRAAAQAALGGTVGFHAVAGSAEHTGIEAGSMDLVVAAQAFHWFDPAPTAREFARILRPGGAVLLAWNTRRTDTPFLRAYEALLHDFATDYARVDHRAIDAVALHDFFGRAPVRRTLPNAQRFDRAALRGRLLSSSYAPPPGHPRHFAMLNALDAVFDAHADAGTVAFTYDTELYFGAFD